MKATSIFTCFLLCTSFVYARPFDGIEKEENLSIFLLIGQSNMAGRAEIEEYDKDTLNGVYLFTSRETGFWEPAANPLNKYSTIRKSLDMQKLGPGYTFSKTMRILFPNLKIGLVVNARGGTSVKEWIPGSEYFEEAVKQLQEATKYGMVKGVLWHQGESDVRNSENYLSNIEIIIDGLRKEMCNPELPFIFGELLTDNPNRKAFNELISTLPDRIPNLRVVSSIGTYTFDGTHFDSYSQRLMGKRYAQEMESLLK